MLKRPAVFHQRLGIHITVAVLIFACFLIIATGFIFDYMSQKTIAERSESAFICLQQRKLIKPSIVYRNPATTTSALNTVFKAKINKINKKAVRKISEIKKIKSKTKLSVSSYKFKAMFLKAIWFLKNLLKAISNMYEFRIVKNIFSNQTKNHITRERLQPTSPPKRRLPSPPPAQMAEESLKTSLPEFGLIPRLVQNQLASIENLEILIWHPSEENRCYFWQRNQDKLPGRVGNDFANCELSTKSGIHLLIKSKAAYGWKYRVRQNFGRKNIFYLEFDMTSLFKKFIVSSAIMIFILILIFLPVLWKIIYIQGNRLEDAILGIEDGLKEVFLSNYKDVLIEAREFVFTQRIANIMNQMIYFFNTHTEKKQREYQEDPLMKIYTRRYLMSTLEKEIIRAQRYRRPLAFILIDMDHFKSINDSYGHLMGDKVLRQTAEILKEHTRETDTVARYGGEEIAIVLSETEIHDAVIVAEKLRRAVEKTRFNFQKQIIRVTISLGVADLGDTEDTATTLIRRADEALYTAKKNGRNRVCKKR